MSTKRLNNLRGNADPVLSGLARQFAQGPFTSQLLLPELLVSEMTGRYPIFGNEHMRVHSTKRALGALPNVMPMDDWSEEKFSLKEYALTAPVDYLETESASVGYEMEYNRYAAEQLLASLILQKEKQAADLVQAESSYNTDNYEALTTNEYFDDADSDPIEIISDMMETVRNKVNRLPNSIVFGHSSFNAVKNHPKVTAKIASTKSAVVTTDFIGELLSQANNQVVVTVGTGMYEDTDGVMKDIWGDVCVGAFNQKLSREMSKYDQSFGKMISRKGYPWVIVDEIKKGMISEISVLLQYQAVITQKDAGFCIANCVE